MSTMGSPSAALLSNDRNDFVLSLQACRRVGRPRSDCSNRRTGIDRATHVAHLAADLGEDRREEDATYSWVRRVPVGADPGALGVAGYAYYDTSAVGQTPMDLFSKDLDGDAGSQLPEGAPKS